MGDCIEGVFIRAEKKTFGNTESMLYHLEVEEKPISVWGCVVLDQKMMFVNPGDKVKITYTGKSKAQPGKNPAKLFSVAVDIDEEDDTI